MAANPPNISSPPCTPASKEELDSVSNSELFSFLSCRRSEFIRFAGILKARENSAKAESLKDLSASLTELQDKNDSLEKEMLALRNNEAEIGKLKQEIRKQKLKSSSDRIAFDMMKKDFEKAKNDCVALRESEKQAREKIKTLMEEARKEREECDNAVDISLTHKYSEIEEKENDLKLDLAVYRTNFSRIKEQFSRLESKYSALEVFEKNTNKKSKILEEAQLKLEKARNARIVEFDLWKTETETWILQFLENNPHLAKKVRKMWALRKVISKYVCESLVKLLLFYLIDYVFIEIVVVFMLERSKADSEVFGMKKIDYNMTVSELKEIAKGKGIKRYSKLKKGDLIQLLKEKLKATS